MFKTLSDSFTLSNGVKIPCVGYGTYRTPDGEVCASGVEKAIECGYRHIDTAEFYDNEAGVGEGISRSGIARKDIFVTSKVWNDNQGYDSALRAFDTSTKKLKTDILDLYLVHWPSPAKFREVFPKMFVETWRALETLYKNGQVRAIGVCNCLPHHLKSLFGEIEVKPMVNQIEYHLGYIQDEAEKFSKENGMLVEAWAPLCKGRAFGFEPLKSIATKYGKTEAQILVRWCLQREVLPLPKSVHNDRIVENANVFDFEISAEDMALLNKFDACSRFGSHPDTCDF
ncbi:MAG: aldo/keto reductase [Clostridia bacterium]